MSTLDPLRDEHSNSVTNSSHSVCAVSLWQDIQMPSPTPPSREHPAEPAPVGERISDAINFLLSRKYAHGGRHPNTDTGGSAFPLDSSGLGSPAVPESDGR
jgi:hypothetical protein